jgi:Ribonuclease G/E
MTLELNLELTPFGARAALLADGKLQDIRFADVAANDLRGQISLGRVRRIDGAMDAAFIDLGHGQTGYLAGRHARWLSGQRQELALPTEWQKRLKRTGTGTIMPSNCESSGN